MQDLRGPAGDLTLWSDGRCVRHLSVPQCPFPPGHLHSEVAGACVLKGSLVVPLAEMSPDFAVAHPTNTVSCLFLCLKTPPLLVLRAIRMVLGPPNPLVRTPVSTEMWWVPHISCCVLSYSELSGGKQQLSFYYCACYWALLGCS